MDRVLRTAHASTTCSGPRGRDDDDDDGAADTAEEGPPLTTDDEHVAAVGRVVGMVGVRWRGANRGAAIMEVDKTLSQRVTVPVLWIGGWHTDARGTTRSIGVLKSR